MKAKYIPNILSIIRLIMAFVFCVVFFSFERGEFIAVLIFFAAGITDILDGFLARRFGWISDSGKILDPIADKTMQIAALIACIARGIVPLWLVFPIILKESIMGIGSLIYYRKTGSVGVSANYGKVYTVLFYVMIGSFIVFDRWFSTHNFAKYALCILVAFSGLFAIELYYKTYLRDSQERKIF